MLLDQVVIIHELFSTQWKQRFLEFKTALSHSGKKLAEAFSVKLLSCIHMKRQKICIAPGHHRMEDQKSRKRLCGVEVRNWRRTRGFPSTRGPLRLRDRRSITKPELRHPLLCHRADTTTAYNTYALNALPIF